MKAVCQRVCKEIGGLSVRAAPRNHPQSHGSVGAARRTLYGQIKALLYQVHERTGIEITSDSPLYPWAVKHAQWLLNRYLIDSDGFTSYFRRWNRNFEGGLCCFGEFVQAKVIGIRGGTKSDVPWKEALWLGRDTEANEITVATTDNVVKVRTVRRLPPSEQWKQAPIVALKALPWKPKTEGEFSTDFILTPTARILTFGKIRAPPGLEPPSQESPEESLPQTEQPPEVPELPDRLTPPELPEHDPALDDIDPSLPGDGVGLDDGFRDDDEQDGDDDPCSRLKNIPDLSEHSRGPTGQTPTIGTTTRLETVR